MPNRLKRRPFEIAMLSAGMVGFSLALIANRLLALRALYVHPLESEDIEGIVVNLRLISGISLLGFGFIPLVLGIGLWQMVSWARVLSICLFSALLFPCLGAAIGIIPDSIPSLVAASGIVSSAHPMANSETAHRLMNLGVAGSSAAVLILLSLPHVGRAFVGRDLDLDL